MAISDAPRGEIRALTMHIHPAWHQALGVPCPGSSHALARKLMGFFGTAETVL